MKATTGCALALAAALLGQPPLALAWGGAQERGGEHAVVREEVLGAATEARPHTMPPKAALPADRGDGTRLHLQDVDADGDGLLSKHEWAALLAKAYPEGNALLSFEDFLTALQGGGSSTKRGAKTTQTHLGGNGTLASRAAVKRGDDNIPSWALRGDCTDWNGKAGSCNVDGLVVGFHRTSCDTLDCLDALAYLKYDDAELECTNTDWTQSFDNEGWSYCEPGYFMAGLRRAKSNDLSAIDGVKCCRVKDRDGLSQDSECQEADWSGATNTEGWVSCPQGTVLQGLQRNGEQGIRTGDGWDDDLKNIEKAKCCPDPFDKKSKNDEAFKEHVRKAVKVEQLKAAAQTSDTVTQEALAEEKQLQGELESMDTSVKDAFPTQWADIVTAVEVERVQEQVEKAEASGSDQLSKLQEQLSALKAQLPPDKSAEVILAEAANHWGKEKAEAPPPKLKDPAEQVKGTVDDVVVKVNSVEQTLTDPALQ